RSFRTDLVSQALVSVRDEAVGGDRPVCPAYRRLRHRVLIFSHGRAEHERPVARQPYFETGRQQGGPRFYVVGVVNAGIRQGRVAIPVVPERVQMQFDGLSQRLMQAEQATTKIAALP